MFKDIALPMARRGVRQVPSFSPRDRFPGPKDWQNIATTDETVLTRWGNNGYAEYNSCSVADDNIDIVDVDDYAAAKALGMPITKTFAVQTPSGGYHLYYRKTERSRNLGNRAMAKVVEFKSKSAAVAAPGCVRDDKEGSYTVRWDMPIVDFPDKLADWVEQNIPRHKSKDATPVRDDFDFDNWASHYDIGYIPNGVWMITDVCPLAGVKHTGSKYTGFYWDGNYLGFKCFSDDCSGQRIGEVIRHLNETHEPYAPIWEEKELDMSWVEDTEQIGATPESFVSHEQIIATLGATLETAPAAAPLAFPTAAMYGKLGEIAVSLGVPLGLAYPSMLAVASSISLVRDVAGEARSNLYVVNIADVGTGKSVAMKRALKSIFLPEGTILKSAGSSDRGIIKILGDRGSCQLLAQDEFRHMMSKMATPGSGIGLTAVCCDLWSDNEAGAADKHGTEMCNSRLSILGNLPCSTPSDFSKIFGAETTKGLADRFIFGYTDERYTYYPVQTKYHVLDNIRPVEMSYPSALWDRRDAWNNVAERRNTRLAENALRIALITAACNGETEISDACLDAAFCFMEWQERLREVFRPGVAENKEAECQSDIVDALLKQLEKQTAEGFTPKGAEDITNLNWTKTLNNQSFYRKHGATLINRVKKSLIEEGIMAEVKKEELDTNCKPTGKFIKTQFVKLLRRLV